jgi:hypothetical protein
MQFWLCRAKEGMYGGRYDFTNYCPYRSDDDDALECMYFWYPHWLGGCEFIVCSNINFSVEALGGEIPPGSCKNLVTGQIVPYKDLLTLNNWRHKRYYEWGVN